MTQIMVKTYQYCYLFGFDAIIQHINYTGTPLHQPEEDQQILPNAIQQQQQQQPVTSQVPPLAPMGGLTPTLGLGMGHAVTMPHTKYVTGFSMPMGTVHSHSGMTPQTPVCDFKYIGLTYL